jgi:hypothetical protein
MPGPSTSSAPSEHPIARAERERIAAILNHPAAAAQPDKARELALTPCLSPQAATTVLTAKGQVFATRAAVLWEKYGKDQPQTQAAEPTAPALVAQPIQPASESFTERARALWDGYGKSPGPARDPQRDDG